MSDMFDFSELSKFEKELIVLANDTMPKEMKKCLGKSGDALLKEVKKVASREVKKGDIKKIETSRGVKFLNYHKRWKKGKVYNYMGNELAIRVYNSSPHAHLIEFGHAKVGHKPDKKSLGGRTQGKHVAKKGYDNFKDTFVENVENFVDEMLDKGLS